MITTAKVFGRKAPVLISKNMLDTIKTPTLFVDMAVSTGGNIEFSEMDKTIKYNDNIRIIGLSEAEQLVPVSASQMFAENIYNFIAQFFDPANQGVVFDKNNEILSKCMLF